MVMMPVFWRLFVLSLACGAAALAAEPVKLQPISHREFPAAWQATEVSSGLTVGPDGKIYFVTGSPRATSRLACFDPKTQQFTQIADLGTGEGGTKARVTAPLVFDQRGTLWLGTLPYQPSREGDVAEVLAFFSKTNDYFMTRLACSVLSLGYHRGNDQLLFVWTNYMFGTNYRQYDMAKRQWVSNGTPLKADDHPPIMVVLRDGRAVVSSAASLYLSDPKTGDLHECKATLNDLFASRAEKVTPSACALAAAPDGKMVYGITREGGVLFAFDPKTEALRRLGPAFPNDPAAEDRMALAVGADGKVYFAGYTKNQGLVGVYNPKTGKREPTRTLASTATGEPLRTPPMAGSACVGQDGRIYLAGYGWAGCGLYAFPPLPEKTPWSTTDRTYESRHVADGAITLDGNLSDPAWQTVTPITGFVSAGPTPQPAKNATTARVAWSDTHLYFAFQCASNGFKAEGTQRDDGIWMAECAELFVCPRGADAPYYEIDANPDGVIYDSRVQTYSYIQMEKHFQEWADAWNGMEAKTTVERDAQGRVTGWNLEARVPFTAFDGGAPTPGDRWLFLPIRIAMTPDGQGEWTCWHPTYADFHKPHQFPKVKFVR